MVSMKRATKTGHTKVLASLDLLRTILGRLHHSGPKGFEGFLATVLAAHFNISVRLAKSGSQFGQDAEGMSPSLTLSLEAKLYTSKLKPESVLSKPTALLGRQNPPDLWVLGATVDASTQIVDPIDAFSRQTGIATEILDWPAGGAVPPLATFCMLAPKSAIDFLIENNAHNGPRYELTEIFRRIGRSPPVARARNELAERLSAPSIGLEFARRRNCDWLKKQFQSKAAARANFGQKVAPLDTHALPLQPRPALETSIKTQVFLTKPSETVFIVGGQGSGKSWAVANAWSSCDAPLTLFLSANDGARLANATKIEQVIVDVIMHQSSTMNTDLAKSRWYRRLDRWRQAQDCTLPRFVIYVDGINQRSDVEWTGILHKLQNFCSELGGTLAVSVRPAVYERRQNQFPEHSNIIQVNNWTNNELAKILKLHELDFSDLAKPVIDTLRAPRLCAIGFELVKSGTLNSLSELTVGRLLHEQILSDETITPADFEKVLENHAVAVRKRIQESHDDPAVFELKDTGQEPLSNRLQTITQDGYFATLPEDGAAYEIRTKSLSLGLAIHLIRRLKRTESKGHNVEATCASLLEPIDAVDETASLVLDALVLAATDPVYSDAIVETLITRYVSLQNVESNTVEAFSALGRNRPSAYLDSLQRNCNTRQSAFNHDWLLLAVINLAENKPSKLELGKRIEDWLSTHTLDAAISTRSETGTKAPNEEEISKQAKKIGSRVESLSDYEQEILTGEMVEDTNLRSYRLIEDAIIILREFDLAPMIRPLTRYILGMQINAPVFHSSRDFESLLRFNERDWSATRKAILLEVSELEKAGASRTGQWAIASLLFATGHAEDVAKAISMRDDLASDEIKALRKRWKNDKNPYPFDPYAETDSGEIACAIDEANKLDLEEWRIGRGQTTIDYKVEKLMPFLARFAPNDAICLQRRLVEETIKKKGEKSSYAIYAISNEVAALTADQEDRLINKALAIAKDWFPADKRQDLICIQYALMSALTARSGNEQIEVLSQLPVGMSLLVKFDEILDAPVADLLETKLENAIALGNSEYLVTMLRFAYKLGQAMTPAIIRQCETLSNHENGIVRAYAYSALMKSNDQGALARFAARDWSSHEFEPRNAYFERWYGSLLLIEAAKHGHISVEDLITRIPATHFGFAIEALEEQVTSVILDTLDTAFNIELNGTQTLEPPVISRPTAEDGNSDMVYVSLDDRITKDDQHDPLTNWNELTESDEKHREKQDRRATAYTSFHKLMAEKGAADFLGDIGYKTFSTCNDLAPGRVSKWGDLIIKAHQFDRRLLKNVGLHIARAVRRTDPELSQELFEKLQSTDGFVRLHNGLSKVPYDTLALWASADNEASINACHKRLDVCATDTVLMSEVLTALMVKKTGLLEAYVANRVDSDHPVDLARAIMVSGIAGLDDTLIHSHIEAAGPIGGAARMAKHLLEKNKWAQYWWSEMTMAPSREDYWRASILFRSSLDGRFDIWEDTIDAGKIASQFWPSLQQKIKQNIQKASKELDKTLFGEHPPKKWFVSSSSKSQKHAG